MATRDDVARLAGTSSAVVSYVVNGGPRNVADATRQRVLAAVQELGYRPNALARGLRSSSSRVLGLILPDIANPFFGELALSVERAAFELGFSLFLGNAMRDDRQQARYLHAFAEHRVEATILIGVSDAVAGRTSSATSQALSAADAPLVFLDRRPKGAVGSVVAVANESGSYQATRHLLDHGHARIATLAGPSRHSVVRERSAGWARALREARIDPRAQTVSRSEFDRGAAYDAATRLLSGPDRPTAIFSHSDEQAFGLLHAATACGVRVPDDLAVVSFDGVSEARLSYPALTTVQQPIHAAGVRAVELAMDLVRDASAPTVEEVLPVSLVVRRSCGCDSERGRP